MEYYEYDDLDSLEIEIESLMTKLKEKKKTYDSISLDGGLIKHVKERPITKLCYENENYGFFGGESEAWKYMLKLACYILGYKSTKDLNRDEKRIAIDFLNDIIPVWNEHFKRFHNCEYVDGRDYHMARKLHGKAITREQKELLERFSWLNETGR